PERKSLPKLSKETTTSQSDGAPSRRAPTSQEMIHPPTRFRRNFAAPRRVCNEAAAKTTAELRETFARLRWPSSTTSCAGARSFRSFADAKSLDSAGGRSWANLLAASSGGCSIAQPSDFNDASVGQNNRERRPRGGYQRVGLAQAGRQLVLHVYGRETRSTSRRPTLATSAESCASRSLGWPSLTSEGRLGWHCSTSGRLGHFSQLRLCFLENLASGCAWTGTRPVRRLLFTRPGGIWPANCDNRNLTCRGADKGKTNRLARCQRFTYLGGLGAPRTWKRPPAAQRTCWAVFRSIGPFLSRSACRPPEGSAVARRWVETVLLCNAETWTLTATLGAAADSEPLRAFAPCGFRADESPHTRTEALYDFAANAASARRRLFNWRPADPVEGFYCPNLVQDVAAAQPLTGFRSAVVGQSIAFPCDSNQRQAGMPGIKAPGSVQTLALSTETTQFLGHQVHHQTKMKLPNCFTAGFPTYYINFQRSRPETPGGPYLARALVSSNMYDSRGLTALRSTSLCIVDTLVLAAGLPSGNLLMTIILAPVLHALCHLLFNFAQSFIFGYLGVSDAANFAENGTKCPTRLEFALRRFFERLTTWTHFFIFSTTSSLFVGDLKFRCARTVRSSLRRSGTRTREDLTRRGGPRSRCSPPRQRRED
uniref:G_PROTEIN_RECEP_F1_2 domain-containing protein n=1 Tax=Macrostomum lignano TaxID=282301 RepID=A0A1I8JQ17_9PLAT